MVATKIQKDKISNRKPSMNLLLAFLSIRSLSMTSVSSAPLSYIVRVPLQIVPVHPTILFMKPVSRFLDEFLLLLFFLGVPILCYILI